MAGVASMLVVRKMPLPEVTHADFVSKGSNSMLLAQWMEFSEIHETPSVSSAKPRCTTSTQLVPPLVLR